VKDCCCSYFGILITLAQVAAVTYAFYVLTEYFATNQFNKNEMENEENDGTSYRNNFEITYTQEDRDRDRKKFEIIAKLINITKNIT